MLGDCYFFFCSLFVHIFIIEKNWRSGRATKGNWRHIVTSNWVFTTDIGIMVWSEKIICQGYSFNWKLAIVKRGMTDWPDNEGKMRSHSNFQLSFYNRHWEIVSKVWFEKFGWQGYSTNRKLAILTHFSPVSHFYTPWKRQTKMG